MEKNYRHKTSGKEVIAVTYDGYLTLPLLKVLFEDSNADYFEVVADGAIEWRQTDEYGFGDFKFLEYDMTMVLDGKHLEQYGPVAFLVNYEKIEEDDMGVYTDEDTEYDFTYKYLDGDGNALTALTDGYTRTGDRGSTYTSEGISSIDGAFVSSEDGLFVIDLPLGDSIPATPPAYEPLGGFEPTTYSQLKAAGIRIPAYAEDMGFVNDLDDPVGALTDPGEYEIFDDPKWRKCSKCDSVEDGHGSYYQEEDTWSPDEPADFDWGASAADDFIASLAEEKEAAYLDTLFGQEARDNEGASFLEESDNGVRVSDDYEAGLKAGLRLAGSMERSAPSSPQSPLFGSLAEATRARLLTKGVDLIGETWTPNLSPPYSTIPHVLPAGLGTIPGPEKDTFAEKNFRVTSREAYELSSDLDEYDFLSWLGLDGNRGVHFTYSTSQASRALVSIALHNLVVGENKTARIGQIILRVHKGLYAILPGG